MNDNDPSQRSLETAGSSRPGVALADVIAQCFRSLRADGAGDEGERAGTEWRALESWCRETGCWLVGDAGPEREGGRVSQPDWISEAPTFEDIKAALTGQGYRKMNLPPLGNYEAHSCLGDGVALFDVHPRNCIVQSSGLMIPFDCIPVVLTDEEGRRLIS